jgi:hypothetical protein
MKQLGNLKTNLFCRVPDMVCSEMLQRPDDIGGF